VNSVFTYPVGRLHGLLAVKSSSVEREPTILLTQEGIQHGDLEVRGADNRTRNLFVYLVRCHPSAAGNNRRGQTVSGQVHLVGKLPVRNWRTCWPFRKTKSWLRPWGDTAVLRSRQNPATTFEVPRTRMQQQARHVDGLVSVIPQEDTDNGSFIEIPILFNEFNYPFNYT
jgi:hypothetical protein